MTSFFEGKKILVTGGTGSLGKALVKNLLDLGIESLKIFSRDEEKQYHMQTIQYPKETRLKYQIGDIRSFNDVARALQNIDIVFNTAALKQVPICESFPYQAVQTNIQGAENIVACIEQFKFPVKTVVGISTDKACKPINAMGISKAMQEKIFLSANLRCPNTKFVAARYGNILGSRGSLIPVFQQQVLTQKQITITHPQMTRFLMSLDEAIALIFKAAESGMPGEIFIPKPISSDIMDIATIFSEIHEVPITEIGIRPGEKMHEILVNEEESSRLVDLGDHYAVVNALPIPIKRKYNENTRVHELSSHDFRVTRTRVRKKLEAGGFI